MKKKHNKTYNSCSNAQMLKTPIQMRINKYVFYFYKTKCVEIEVIP